MSREDIGYKKPPRATQFKPGQSGNPKGRAKGSENVRTLIQKAHDAKVFVTLNGKRRSVSKLQAAFIQQANKAAAGDLKATKLLTDLLSAGDPRNNTSDGVLSPEAQRQQNLLILAALQSRIADDGGDNGPAF